MKVFVWQEVEELTSNYHSTGGLVVVAESLEAARALVNAQREQYAVKRAEWNAEYAKLQVEWAKNGKDQKWWTENYAAFNKTHPMPHASTTPVAGCVDDQEPDAAYTITGVTEPCVYVFPDAGCC